MAAHAESRSSGPRYQQIADDLEQQIRAGLLAGGQALPSESVLEQRYAASVGTVRRAIAVLRAADLVETRHGAGSFVKRRPPVKRKSSDRFRRSHRKAGKAAYLAESEQAGVTARVEVLYVGPQDAPVEVAQMLGVDAGADVLARRRLYFSDDIATEEATSYLPWDVARDIPQLFAENPGPGGIYARLEEHGHMLEEFAETVRVRVASKAEASALQLSPGAPVIHLTRQAFSEAGRVVEVCDTVMAGDRFVLDYRIPARD